MEKNKATDSPCNLCPRRCGALRAAGARGFCGAGSLAKVALVSLHPWEEPCLAGEKGAGTVFFSHCELRCVFCQNHAISTEGFGIEVSTARLAEIFLEQQAKGAATLDLVSPTHYAMPIREALLLAKQQGLQIPVVYNSSGYESVATLEAMRGLVDVFLPDFKYLDEAMALRYSSAPHYFAHASQAILKMRELMPQDIFDATGRMQKGLLIRLLVLPNHRRDSMAVLDWLAKHLGTTTRVSIMRQYTPMYRAANFPEINRPLTTFEYESVVRHALSLGFTHAYVQEGAAVSESFVPAFDGHGVMNRK